MTVEADLGTEVGNLKIGEPWQMFWLGVHGAGLTNMVFLPVGGGDSGRAFRKLEWLARDTFMKPVEDLS
ncbi:hypothetical protein HPP92_004869 [Vanilla planifolia]|uniref:Uncharacterized protein n=1 Tax=Vanilla planifolia TaxID=51239 RepID=A0A835VCP0_VANPL|nr:hypothetical protein HPP92_004869 [Vanilla planifolia]